MWHIFVSLSVSHNVRKRLLHHVLTTYTQHMLRTFHDKSTREAKREDGSPSSSPPSTSSTVPMGGSGALLCTTTRFLVVLQN